MENYFPNHTTPVRQSSSGAERLKPGATTPDYSYAHVRLPHVPMEGVRHTIAEVAGSGGPPE